MDKGHEQGSRFRAQHVREDAQFEVVFEFMARRVQGVFQNAGITTASGWAASFLNLVIGRIREAQDQLPESLVELVFFREELQTLALRFLRRDENKIAVTGESRTGYPALQWRQKAYRPRVQKECPCVPLHDEITDTNRFSGQSKIAKLLVSWIGVRSNRGAINSIQRDKWAEPNSNDHRDIRRQGAKAHDSQRSPVETSVAS